MIPRKWTDAEALQFRRDVAAGRKTISQLAKDNGTHYSVMCSLVDGTTYKNVEMPPGVLEALPTRKLTVPKVRAIKRAIEDGRKHINIANEFGISSAMVSMIKTGKRFADV